MDEQYFDIYNKKRSDPKGEEPQNPGVRAESAESDEAEPMEKTQERAESGSYSYRGSEIPEGRTSMNPPEYEVSYNSARREYSYSDSFSMGGPYPPAAPAPVKSRKTGWIAAALALAMVFSGMLGGLCGYFAASKGKSSSGGGAGGPGTGLPVNAVVDKYTAVIENPVSNQQNALTNAAKIAYDSVVIIDVYASEEYERVGQPSGSGSGVIWTSDGYIVTCNHVVEGAAVVKVTLTDGKSYAAQVVGTDPRTDLAVLVINAAESELYPAIQRDEVASPLVLAETVLAIGNPLGVLGGTATDGILSALERNIVVEGQSMTLLQTSASVNSGNSGGGLFDINGSLIGIVNAKSTGENVEGLGFAIPITTVKKVANELIANGYVTGRPQLGVQVVTVTASNSSYIFGADGYPDLKSHATKSGGWGRDTVVYGVYLIDGSAVKYAEGSDQMAYGDRITQVGTRQVSEVADITQALNDFTAGETISVTVVRNQSQTITVQIVLGQAGA